MINPPSDYILYRIWPFMWDGISVNFGKEAQGGVVCPVVADETWYANIDRITNNGDRNITWQYKNDTAGSIWIEPQAAVTTVDGWDAPVRAFYQQVFDYGAVLEGTVVTFSPTTEKPATAIYNVRIEGAYPPEGRETDPTWVPSESDWYIAADNAASAVLSKFRAVRVTITVPEESEGIIHFIDASLKLDARQKRDSGMTLVLATDNDPLFSNDPTSENYDFDLIGKYVEFNQVFVDIAGQPDLVAYTVPENGGVVDYSVPATSLRPICVFKDTPYPLGFRIAVFNDKGERVDAYVKWTAEGV
jgi:hypothetical protein